MNHQNSYSRATKSTHKHFRIIVEKVVETMEYVRSESQIGELVVIQLLLKRYCNIFDSKNKYYLVFMVWTFLSIFEEQNLTFHVKENIWQIAFYDCADRC